MPIYPGASGAIVPAGSPPRAVYLGDQAYLFGTPTNTYQAISDTNVTGETPAAGQASISVCLAPRFASIVPNIGVQFIFNGNPGAANFQIQEADSDCDGLYITPSPAAFTVTTFTQVGANWAARVDIGTFGSRFARILCSANPNAVTVIAKLSMQ